METEVHHGAAQSLPGRPGGVGGLPTNHTGKRCGSGHPRRSPSTITWVEATLELPDDDMTVLIALSDGEVWTGFMDAGDWRFVSAELVDQGSGTTVTHWAEFPEPPSQSPT